MVKRLTGGVTCPLLLLSVPVEPPEAVESPAKVLTSHPARANALKALPKISSCLPVHHGSLHIFSAITTSFGRRGDLIKRLIDLYEGGNFVSQGLNSHITGECSRSG